MFASALRDEDGVGWGGGIKRLESDSFKYNFVFYFFPINLLLS